MTERIRTELFGRDQLMKKILRKGCYAALMLCLAMCFGMTVQAKGEETIKTGVYAESVDLSGKTKEEAIAAIDAFVEELAQVEVTLLAADSNKVVVTVGDLGISWINREVVDEALQLGTQGNIIERYKALKDLEHDNYVYELEFAYDLQMINDVLTEDAAKFDREAVDFNLVRENETFRVVEGQTGYKLDVETSIDLVYDHMVDHWDHEPCEIALDIYVTNPRGSAEELAAVQDKLGTFTTSYASSGTSRSANVSNGSRLINGVLLYPGDEFSTYENVAPFTEKNGYYMAGSYLNGKVVDSLGGGICQVSTTLYNAVLKAELEVTERHNHSMSVAYVDPSADAAIAESAGKDFRFVNNTDYPVYVESFTNKKNITVNVYGKETRSEGRKVTYESEVLQVINPGPDQIYADGSQPIGYIYVDSAHIGYKAKLWKVVTEGGKEVSREQVNSSNYKMTPRSATVGVATGDPAAQAEIMAAIGTSNIDHVKNVIAILTAPPATEEAPQ